MCNYASLIQAAFTSPFFPACSVRAELLRFLASSARCLLSFLNLWVYRFQHVAFFQLLFLQIIFCASLFSMYRTQITRVSDHLKFSQKSYCSAAFLCLLLCFTLFGFYYYVFNCTCVCVCVCVCVVCAVLMSLSTNFIMSFLGVFLLMAFSPGYEFYFHAFCITGILFKCQALWF